MSFEEQRESLKLNFLSRQSSWHFDFVSRFMGAALTSSPAATRRMPSREPAALETREVDHLVSRLLAEIKIPFESLGTRVLNQLSDLKKILSADYVDVPALPSKPLLKELAKIIENDIKRYTSADAGLADLGSPQVLGYLGKL